MNLTLENQVRLMPSGEVRIGTLADYVSVSPNGVITMVGAAKRTLVERPAVNHGVIAAKAKPATEILGANQLYIMPIWSTPANADEQLFFKNIVPARWDGASDITFVLKVALGGVEDVGDKAQFQLSWAHNGVTGVMSDTVLSTTAELTVATGRAAKYDIYVLSFTMDYDGMAATIAGRDGLVGRIRRIAASSNEVAASPYISNWYLVYNVDKVFGGT